MDEKIDLNQLWADEMNGVVPSGTYHKELQKQYPSLTMDEGVKEIEKNLNYMKSCDPESLLQSEKYHMKTVEHLLSKIKELEDRVELAEATRDDALAYGKMFKERVKEKGNDNENRE